jgi:hypothetical protein
MASAGDPRIPDRVGWLLLVYRVPSEPTRLRATVWRRLKSLGAVYLQNSAAALPATPATERAMRKLRHDITDMGGSAQLLECVALVGEAEIVDSFQRARNDEYEEIDDRCEDFLRQVQKEHDAEHFTYAELEENEVDLAKLRSWLAKVVERDAFAASGRRTTEEWLVRCDAALEGYAAEVYAHEADAH